MVEDASPGKRRLDRVLSDEFLLDPSRLPLEELRARRDEAEQEEADISYLRRLIQGRMDIVRAEVARRSSGGGSILADLPRILSEGTRGPARGLGRHRNVEPSRADEHRRYVERLVGDVDLSDVGARSDEELEGVLELLRREEDGLNTKRRRIHQILDVCSTEIGRRYRDGEADVSDLLTGPAAPTLTADHPVTVVAEVVRSGHVESRHHGSVVALDRQGARRLELGEVAAPVFPRSANKPLQAAAVLRLGLIEEFGLDDRHVALAAASHSGEPGHLEVVRELLELAGVAETDLGCPASLPLDEQQQQSLLRRGLGPARILHNCSGKHAAMLAACRAAGWPLADYLSPDHPLQQQVRRTLEELAAEAVTAVAVDGCGAPLHALTLSGLATAFSRLVTAPEGSVELRVATAMRARPELAGGTGRDVTTLMTAVPGLLAKDGAEGCYAAATADGVGVALKIDDGAARARTPLLVAALRTLGVAGDETTLDALATPPVLGGGVPVGVVRVPAVLASPLAFASTTRLS